MGYIDWLSEYQIRRRHFRRRSRLIIQLSKLLAPGIGIIIQFYDPRVVLDVSVRARRDTDPAAAFLHGLSEQYDLSETVFLVIRYMYLTSVYRLGLKDNLGYVEKTLSKNGLHTEDAR